MTYEGGHKFFGSSAAVRDAKGRGVLRRVEFEAELLNRGHSFERGTGLEARAAL